ncbi:MAG: hypothetical protein NBV68_06185 [Erythrobacter sp.]|uniref:hypothetical protein n=1 Tax=Erythrobacter sp. TaxID=1042 RepID=UPI0025FB9C8C|nr:hypothetical protein [Erythrobacter sp.]MCL9998951.1 hypothetical protein [Erythrobacter sp.]
MQNTIDKAVLFFYFSTVLFVASAARRLDVDPVDASYLWTSLFMLGVGSVQLIDLRAKKQVLSFSLRANSRSAERLNQRQDQLKELRDKMDGANVNASATA